MEIKNLTDKNFGNYKEIIDLNSVEFDICDHLTKFIMKVNDNFKNFNQNNENKIENDYCLECKIFGHQNSSIKSSCFNNRIFPRDVMNKSLQISEVIEGIETKYFKNSERNLFIENEYEYEKEIENSFQKIKSLLDNVKEIKLNQKKDFRSKFEGNFNLIKNNYIHFKKKLTTLIYKNEDYFYPSNECLNYEALLSSNVVNLINIDILRKLNKVEDILDSYFNKQRAELKEQTEKLKKFMFSLDVLIQNYIDSSINYSVDQLFNFTHEIEISINDYLYCFDEIQKGYLNINNPIFIKKFEELLNQLENDLFIKYFSKLGENKDLLFNGNYENKRDNQYKSKSVCIKDLKSSLSESILSKKGRTLSTISNYENCSKKNHKQKLYSNGMIKKHEESPIRNKNIIKEKTIKKINEEGLNTKNDVQTKRINRFEEKNKDLRENKKFENINKISNENYYYMKENINKSLSKLDNNKIFKNPKETTNSSTSMLKVKIKTNENEKINDNIQSFRTSSAREIKKNISKSLNFNEKNEFFNNKYIIDKKYSDKIKEENKGDIDNWDSKNIRNKAYFLDPVSNIDLKDKQPNNRDRSLIENRVNILNQKNFNVFKELLREKDSQNEINNKNKIPIDSKIYLLEKFFFVLIIEKIGKYDDKNFISYATLNTEENKKNKSNKKRFNSNLISSNLNKFNDSNLFLNENHFENFNSCIIPKIKILSNEILIFNRKKLEMKRHKIRLIFEIHGIHYFLDGCRYIVIDDKIYISGGRSEERYFKIFLEYDFTNKKLRRLEDLCFARAYHKMIYCENKQRLYFLGGENNKNCEFYDFQLKKNLPLPNLNEGKSYLNAYLTKDGKKLFALFGMKGKIQEPHFSPNIEILDLEKIEFDLSINNNDKYCTSNLKGISLKENQKYNLNGLKTENNGDGNNLKWELIEYKNSGDLDMKFRYVGVYPLNNEKLILIGGCLYREIDLVVSIYDIRKNEITQIDSNIIDEMKRRSNDDPVIMKILSQIKSIHKRY